MHGIADLSGRFRAADQAGDLAVSGDTPDRDPTDRGENTIV